MGRNWAITIGINRYTNLQALQFAKRDADLMREFFQDEIQFERVYHFTDDSPAISQDYGPDIESRPTFATLRRFLRVRFETDCLRAGDNLWFFFAGHGVRHEGRDYLMPLDADPGDIESTAISLSHVTERLYRSGADNVVLLVDACRSHTRAGLGVGSELQKGVITLFACSPQETSHEIDDPAIQQGAFTYTLLKGLRMQGEDNCATVERLNHYLYREVPRLNYRYGKPRQTPYCRVEPLAKSHMILLPEIATVADIRVLKYEASQAELNQDFHLAEQLWIRVLAVSPADPEAIGGIKRLSSVIMSSQTPEAPVTPKSTIAGWMRGKTSGSTSEAISNSAHQQSPLKSDNPVLKQTINPKDVSTPYGTKEINIDYSNLEKLLRSKEYRKADQETYNLILFSVNREKKRWFTEEAKKQIDSKILIKINQLWDEFSDGKCSFEVQKKIWKTIENKSFVQKIYIFGNIVGWRCNDKWLDYSNFKFDPINMEMGHLPSFGYGEQIWKDWRDGFLNFIPCLLNVNFKNL